MGQYYYAINLDKQQYLHPHRFGDGLKLMEFGLAGCGTMAGLAILLADGNGRGGGDLHSGNPIIGSWAGDRIIIGGDYADNAPDQEAPWHDIAAVHFEEISAQVIAALCDDEYANSELSKQVR